MYLKKQIRRKMNLKLSFLLLFCFFIIAINPISVKAAGNAKIKSMDDFYVKLSNQIFAHEVDVKYDVPDYELVKQIMELSMEDYRFHYDVDNPIISGCYLSYYIHGNVSCQLYLLVSFSSEYLLDRNVVFFSRLGNN